MSDTSASSSTSTVQHTRSRKRPVNKSKWKVSVSKKKRNLGEEYVSVKTKQAIKARTIGAPCKCGCFEKIGMDKIQTIFNEFWKIGDYEIQNAYLNNLMKSVDVKRSRVKNRPSRRLRSVEYRVIYHDVSYSVCALAFRNIHGLTERRLRTVRDKVGESGCLNKDKRGHQKKSREVPEPTRQKVIEHINSLPALSSHYSRAKSPNRKYLSPELNVSKLYDLYCDWLIEYYPDEQSVKESFYRHIFNTKFNLGFTPPMSDTCNYCDKVKYQIQNLDEVRDVEQINKLIVEKELHNKTANMAHTLIKNFVGSQNSTVAAIAIDLQQALPTPKINSGIQYYKRKLWTYNLGIHNIVTGQASMYIWDETVGKRGSSEIASCLMHYITPQVDTLHIFSDNCSGQNKNINMVLTCLRNIHSGRFKKIEHSFMVPGHSYLPCDRDFGNIELYLKKREVYTSQTNPNVQKVKPF